MALTKVTYSMIQGEVSNVLDFGADSTGVNDSSTAFANALAASNNIYIPAGTYKLNSAVIIPPYGQVVGDGIANTIITAANDNVTFVLQYWSQLRELKIVKSGSHTKNLVEVGSLTLDAGRAYVNNVWVEGAGQDGIQLIYGNLAMLENVVSINNTRDGVHFSNVSGDLNACVMQGYSDLRSNGRDGLHIAMGANLSDPLCSKSNFITGVVAQSNTRYGVYIGTRSNIGTFYTESNGSAGVYLDTYARGNEIKTVDGSVTDNSANSQFNIVYNYNAAAGYQRIFQNLTYFSGKTGAGLGIYNDDSTVGTLQIHKTGDKQFDVTAGSSSGNQVIRFLSEVAPSARLDTVIGGHCYPYVDNAYSSGTASYRWSVIYAGTGTINTSDANQKADIVDISDIEKRVAIKLKSSMKRFKFKNGKRYHFGTIAQNVKSAFESEGLNAEEYGVFCLDTLEDGSVRLGVRYDELFAFIISAL